MQVEFKKQASKRLENSITYCVDNFGEKYAIAFYNKVKERIKELSMSPECGFLEPLLKERKRKYRAILVYKHFKFIYYIDDNKATIYICDLWDTRREPKSLKKRFRGK